LLHVPQVIEDHGVIAIELLEQGIQAEVLLGRQKLLHQLEGWRASNRQTVPQDQFPSHRT
jgi:hypothetical protein